MATVIEPRQKSEKYRSLVDEQIAQTSNRILAYDVTFGVFCLAALAAFYAAAMMLLDKSLNLSEWFRQISLFGFCSVFVILAYRLIGRPLRSRVNPLYAANRVEKTIDDAKNSVTGYVEAQEKGHIHAAIKAAMSARAAQSVGNADVNHAIDHRGLQVAGGIFVALVLTLILLFFVFRPNQFKSLLSRSFVPFTSDPIASRTQLQLIKPDPAEPTITTGQTITVAVHVSGKVPSKDSPERVRVLIRHNQADLDYEEVALKEGETSRDWLVKVPEDLVLNGFYYKVAAGDTETPEYRVSVRSLPLFTGFQATYQYPAYTHKPADSSISSEIRALRGTQVTLVAQTNRDVKDGLLKMEAGGKRIEGKPVVNRPDSLVFQFKVEEPTKYWLYMTTSSGEKNSDPPPYSINVDSDLPPTVRIIQPQEPETLVPLNGQLAIDASIGDDYGIDKVRLRLKVDGRDLAPVPYQNGQSFRRTKDDTWPRDLQYKDHADFTKLTYPDGTAFVAQEGMRLEYWLEAIDNCSEARPVPEWNNQKGNVGRSVVQSVRLTAPRKSEEKQQLDQQKSERQKEENQHNQQQEQKFANENREQKPQDGDPKPQGADQKTGDQQNNGNADPNTQPMPGSKEPQSGDQNGMGNNNPMNSKPDNQNTDPNARNDPDDKQSPKGQSSNAENNPRDRTNGTDTNDNQQQKNNNGASDPNKKPDPQSGSPNTQSSSQDRKTGDMNSPSKNGANNSDAANNTNNSGGMDQKTNPEQGRQNADKPDSRKAEEQAEQVQKELERNRRPEGEAKPNPSARPEDRTDPATSKPQPMNGGNNSQPEAAAKPDAAQNQPQNSTQTSPMGGNNAAPSESKPAGDVEKPSDPAASKPMPGQSSSNDQKSSSAQPAENREEPLGGSPGQEKPQPASRANKPDSQPDKNPGHEKTGENGSQSGGTPDSGSPNKTPGDPKEQQPGTAGPKPGDPKQQQPGNNGGKPDGTPEKNPPGARSDETKDPQSASGAGQRNDSQPKDPTSGSTAKPAANSNNTKPENGHEAGQTKTSQQPSDPSKGAAKAKPQSDLGRGQEKEPPQNGGQSASSEDAAMPKPRQTPESATPKPDSQKGAAPKGDNVARPKPQPSEEPGDKGSPGAESKPDRSDSPMTPGGKNSPDKGMNTPSGTGQQSQDDKNLPPGEDKPSQPQAQNPSAAGKPNSDADQKRQPGSEKGDNRANNPPLDSKKMEELKNAAKDLNNPDPQKRQEARNKLDESIGEQNRKALEDFQKNKKEEFDQLQKDLQSSDKGTREAAEKKAQDLMKQAAEQANKNNGGSDQQPQQKENGLSPEQVRDLASKAKDLNSPDEAKRREAEKALDDKLGKETREKLQYELKGKPGGDGLGDQELQKKIEQQAREQARSGKGPVDPQMPRGQPGASTDPLKPALADDPRNRARAAELRLEEFEKNRYNKELQDKLGWTQEQYDDFLKAQQKRVEQMQKEALTLEQDAKREPVAPGVPTINAGGSTKVETRGNGTKGSATGTGSVYAAPGFESSKQKFAEALDRMQQKKP